MKTRTDEQIIKLLIKHKRLRTKDISKHLDISDRAVYKQLNKLVEQGRVEKFGRPPKVYYILTEDKSLMQTVKERPFKVTKQLQLKELKERVPPVLNVDLLIAKDDKYLMGRRSPKKSPTYNGFWLFPGGRVKYDETPQEAVMRILKDEVPGVKATLRRLVTAVSDMGYDPRANGVTLYYLLDYISGDPKENYQLDAFKWLYPSELANEECAYWIDKGLVSELEDSLRQMHNNQDELLVEVDASDKEIGQLIKRVAHSNNQRYHRAAHIFIFTSDGQVVLHQRSQKKLMEPGRWDMFGGHQVVGQTIDQCAYAELAEELGINCNLKFVKKSLYRDAYQSEYAYLYYGVDNGPYGFDRNEVEQISFFDCEKLLAGDYNDDFDILPHVFGYIEDLRDVWSSLGGR